MESAENLTSFVQSFHLRVSSGIVLDTLDVVEITDVPSQEWSVLLMLQARRFHNSSPYVLLGVRGDAEAPLRFVPASAIRRRVSGGRTSDFEMALAWENKLVAWKTKLIQSSKTTMKMSDTTIPWREGFDRAPAVSGQVLLPAPLGTYADSTVRFLLEVGMHRIPHNGARLLDHLLGVGALLERWQCRPPVCLAGLCHGVYSLEWCAAPLAAPLRPPNARDLLRMRIGADAEDLVWLLHSMDHGHFTTLCDIHARQLASNVVPSEKASELMLTSNAYVPISQQQVRDLSVIMQAKNLEQELRRPPASLDMLQRKAKQLEALAVLLPADAVRDVGEWARSCAGFPSSLGALLAAHDGSAVESFVQTNFIAGVPLHVRGGPVDRLRPWLPTVVQSVTGAAGLSIVGLGAASCTLARCFQRDSSGSLNVVEYSASEANRVEALYAAGATVQLLGVFTPTLRDLLGAVEHELSLPAGAAGVTVTAARQPMTSPLSYDSMDHLVIQLRGCRRWRLARNAAVSAPTMPYILGDILDSRQEQEVAVNADFSSSGVCANAAELELAPGDTLFVPSAYWRQTLATDTESVHLCVELALPTLFSLTNVALKRFYPYFAHVDFRRGVYGAFDGNGSLRHDMRAPLLALLRRFMDSLSNEDMLVHADEVLPGIAEVQRLRNSRRSPWRYIWQ